MSNNWKSAKEAKCASCGATIHLGGGPRLLPPPYRCHACEPAAVYHYEEDDEIGLTLVRTYEEKLAGAERLRTEGNERLDIATTAARALSRCATSVELFVEGRGGRDGAILDAMTCLHIVATGKNFDGYARGAKLEDLSAMFGIMQIVGNVITGARCGTALAEVRGEAAAAFRKLFDAIDFDEWSGDTPALLADH